MNNSDEIQESIVKAIETIIEKKIENMNITQVITARITGLSKYGDSCTYMYQNQEYIGHRLTNESYSIGDIVLVLTTNNDEMKNFVLSKTK